MLYNLLDNRIEFRMFYAVSTVCQEIVHTIGGRSDSLNGNTKIVERKNNVNLGKHFGAIEYYSQ